jgi:hypothetical protein
MLKIRHAILVLGMLLSSAATADVQMSIGIGFPNASIGINLPVYPQLVVVPGYPVYYAPQLDANYFFYDGMYWVYQDDDWYASSWYNGPWWLVEPEAVPLYILRIPVRYYRQPPDYFFGWRSNAPPRWGDHWGYDWGQRRSGWDRWSRRAVPPPAPLPAYQRQYSRDRYPEQVEQQQRLQQQHYRYQPRDPEVRQHTQMQAVPLAPAQRERQGAPEQRGFRQQEIQRFAPPQQLAPAAPRAQPPQRRGEDVQRSAPVAPQQVPPQYQDRRQPSQPAVGQREQPREQPKARSQGQEERQRDQDTRREQKPDKGQEQERGRDRERGRNE